jgi:hypothetical protein
LDKDTASKPSNQDSRSVFLPLKKSYQILDLEPMTVAGAGLGGIGFGVGLDTDKACDVVVGVPGMAGGTIDLLALGLLALGTNGFHAFLPDLRFTYRG